MSSGNAAVTPLEVVVVTLRIANGKPMKRCDSTSRGEVAITSV